ncbi:MAG: heparinase II/III family protein [Planctomycetes bacterium]|nr:heparinase II/III family protein [Planctomycetota bacterium]MBL7144988.1 heparinase II/III family protein [Phycisphaerae bacterium]
MRFRTCIIYVILIGLCVEGHAGQTVKPQKDNTIYKPVPINMAEAIIEPFWSPGLSGLNQWTVNSGDSYGLIIKQNWDVAYFEWASRPAQGPALRMYRDFNIDCAGYDVLLVCLTAPIQSILRITAVTDLGKRVFKSEPASENTAEHSLDLQGAKVIKTIILEIETKVDGPGAGWFSWIGLQNTEQLSNYFALWDYSQIQWDKHIKEANQISRFEPRYGIFLNASELAELRSQHQQAVKETGQSHFTQRALAARSFHPEKGIHEYVNSGGTNKSHGRIRDQFQAPLSGNPDLAIAGLVLQDADALRMAARYALSLAMSEHWDTGFMSRFPSDPWEDRAFRRSYTAEDIAMILDLAGEVLTETGRTFLMRRLAEEGVGLINYVAWRHEYIFHCNQLAYFNTGRMYAYLVLEREWPRVKPYTDLAYLDAINNLENAIQPDGGTLEGPGYLNPIARENYKAIKHYARSRGRNVTELVPNVLKLTADYAAVVASTTEGDVIPICDSGPDFRSDTLEILTELMPESHWTTMYNKLLLRNGKPKIAQTDPAPPAFITLPDTGYIASTRSLGEHRVKLFIMGHKAGADHTHEDKGSFVLEFAGQAFALDLGICDYGDPISAIYKHCQRHNMLAPARTPDRACPQRPLPIDVKPTGYGDEKAFHARIDATPGWEQYYRKWIRSWESPSPDTLIIRDEYALASGNAVEFYWQTKLPVRQHDRTVIIEGKQGRASLKIPADCTVRIDRLPLAEGQEHNRITIGKSGSEGVLEVKVHLSAVSDAIRNDDR